MATPLQIVRKKLKFTLHDVAVPVGLDPGNLSRIERRKQGVTPDVAEKLSRFYKEKGGDISELEILYPERYVDQEELKSN